MDLKTLLSQQWDRSAAVGATALGALLLVIGWFGTSGSPLLAEQAPYILSGGVGGVFLVGVGATLWISADLRDEWRKLDRIEAALVEGQLRFVEDAAALPAQRTEPAPAPAYDEYPVEDVLEPAPTPRRLKSSATPAVATAGVAARRRSRG